MNLSDWLRRIEVHYGPVNKGDAAKGAALTNAQTGQQQSNTLFGEGQNTQNELLPFLQQEMTNPQGFGQPTLNAMNTAAGQTASGSLSNAEQQAKLRAARTGNQAGESAIIANAARSGANSMTDANLKTQIGNAEEKLKQQQAGAAGVGDLANADLGDSLKALGLSSDAVNAWSGANKSAGNIMSNFIDPLAQIGLGSAKAAGFG